MSPIVYLAGPDVFLPDPIGHAASLKEICNSHGLSGLFPMDNVLVEPTARNIYLENVDMIRRADAVIASLEPFRGPGMDSGTAFEIGLAVGLGKPVFGYLGSEHPRSYGERSLILDKGCRKRENGAWEDSNGMEIEHFCRDGTEEPLEENLMIVCALREERVYSSFEDAVKAAAGYLSSKK